MTVDAATSALVGGTLLLIVVAALPLRPSGHRLVSPADTAAAAERPPPARAQWRHLVDQLTGRGARRSRSAEPAALAEWCDDLSRRVRAGASLRDALGRAVPHDATCRQLSSPLRRAIERGVPTEDAVRLMTGGGADLDLAATVVATAARLGGSPAAAIDRTATALRQRSADRDDRLVQSAQARLSAQVLTVLPVAILGVLLLADDDVRTAVTAPVGAACVAVGLVLNTVGWCWMRRVVGP